MNDLSPGMFGGEQFVAFGAAMSDGFDTLLDRVGKGNQG